MNLYRKYVRTQQNQEVIVYNAILDLLCSNNQMEKVTQLFDHMVKTGDVKPDEVTYNTLIKGFCK